MTDTELLGADSATYANVFTFMGLPLSRQLDDAVNAAILGVPYDLATSARPGARFGPTGIRQASTLLRWEKRRWPWPFALDERLHTIDYGDLSFDPSDNQGMVDLVTEHAGRIVEKGKFLLTFGGDHFVSLPVLRGVAKTHRPVALVHFDAHTDLEPLDLPFYHGNMFYRALNEGLIDRDHSIQLGIRTEHEADSPLKILDASWVNNHDAAQAAKAIVETVGDRPVYLSVDIDVLDPAFAPGTGTPVAGGLSSDRLLQILRLLPNLNLIAADVMEVAPAYDPAQVTSLAAATVGLDLLYLHAARHG